MSAKTQIKELLICQHCKDIKFYDSVEANKHRLKTSHNCWILVNNTLICKIKCIGLKILCDIKNLISTA